MGSWGEYYAKYIKNGQQQTQEHCQMMSEPTSTTMNVFY